jgi:hypothetical protein
MHHNPTTIPPHTHTAEQDSAAEWSTMPSRKKLKLPKIGCCKGIGIRNQGIENAWIGGWVRGERLALVESCDVPPPADAEDINSDEDRESE